MLQVDPEDTGCAHNTWTTGGLSFCVPFVVSVLCCICAVLLDFLSVFSLVLLHFSHVLLLIFFLFTCNLDIA